MILAEVAMHMSAATRDQVGSSKRHVLWCHTCCWPLHKLLRHPRLTLTVTHASHQRITSTHILFSLSDQRRYRCRIGRLVAKKATWPANVRQRRTMHARNHPHFLPFAFAFTGSFFIALWRVTKKRRERLSSFSCRRLRVAVRQTHITPHSSPSWAWVSLQAGAQDGACRMMRSSRSEQDCCSGRIWGTSRSSFI